MKKLIFTFLLAIACIYANATKIKIYYFLATTCPISQKYTQEINRLNKVYTSKDIEMFLVFPTVKNNKKEVEAFYATYQMTMPYIMDRNFALTKQLNAKIKEDDTLFLKKIGIQDTKKLSKIEIDPIIDVYQFIDNNAENFELIKLMAEDGNMEKILKDKITSKNYPYHLISFTTLKATTQQKTLQPILDFLNDSDYFKKLQTEVINNTEVKMKFNEQMLTQIDGILNEFSSSLDASALKSDRLVYYNNENTQLNDVLKTKEGLIYDQSQLRISKINSDKIIKDISNTLNIKNRKITNSKLKFILPILFVFGFIAVGAFFRFYKRQQLKMTEA
jgi:hypothetical protein